MRGLIRQLARPETPLARIAHMSAAFVASDVVRGVIALATTVAIGRGLGREAFGQWTLWMALASTVVVACDLGFGTLLTREAARSEREAGAVLGAALGARLIVAVPLAAGVVIAAPLFGIRPAAGVGGVRVVTWLVLLVALAAASVAYGCFAALFRAWPRRVVPILTIESGGAALQCVGAIGAIWRGYGVPALVVLAAAVQGLQLVAALALWRLVRREERLLPASADNAIRSCRRAIPFALAGIVASAQSRIAPLLVGYYAGMGEAGLFGAAWRISAAARKLPYAAFTAALPVFAHETERGGAEPARRRFDRVLIGFTVAAGAGLTIAARPIVSLTYGTRFADAVPVLVWLGVALGPALANTSRRVYLNASGREAIAVRWSAATLAVQFAASIALVPRFGAAGAACALAVAEGVVWLPLRRAEAVSAAASGTTPRTAWWSRSHRVRATRRARRARWRRVAPNQSAAR